ncbi:MAG TPA: hypothetical protein PKN81_05035 [Anaerolineales bacterium]|nr:hypothetical protein [Anaerolineales bacterium]
MMIGKQFHAFPIGQAPICNDKGGVFFGQLGSGFCQRAHAENLKPGILVFEGALDKFCVRVFVFD